MDYTEKIIDVFEDPNIRDVDIAIIEFRDGLDVHSKAQFDSNLVELLDSKDTWILIYTLQLIGTYFKIKEAKNRLLILLKKDFVFQNDTILRFLISAFDSLEIKESVPFLCEYLEEYFQKGNYKGNTESSTSTALHALITNDPYKTFRYMRQYFDFEYTPNTLKEEMGDLDIIKKELPGLDDDGRPGYDFGYFIWRLLIRTGVKGLPRLLKEFETIDRDMLKYFCLSLEHALLKEDKDNFYNEPFSKELFDEVKKEGLKAVHMLRQNLSRQG